MRVQNEENVKRATAQINCPTKAATSTLVKAFGLYKFKAFTTDQWKLVKRPARAIVAEKDVRTMVCVALEDLGPHNGFPFELRQGQDVCIDGYDTLLLPPTGGGKAILIWIDLG